VSKAEDEFNELAARYNALNTSWRSELLLGLHRQPKPVLENVLIALRRAPEWQGVLGYDEFGAVIMAMQPPPWAVGQHNSWQPRRWGDDDDVRTIAWMQRNDICINSMRSVAAAVVTVALENSFHPIRNYFDSLRWDEGERVEGFAANMLGAERTPYHETVSRVLFVSAVARILDPGCKADCIPVLEGAQGIGKSSALKALFAPWFSDDLAELGSKDASMQVRVAWCIELAELSAMSAAETEKIKAFISRSVDRFRPSYGRHVIEAPRQSVLIGTTNATVYLRDETGGRRFLPVECTKVDLERIKQCRDQLWAEAVDMYRRKVQWWLDDDAAAAEQQSARYVSDEWESKIETHTAGLATPDISIGEVMGSALSLEVGQWRQADQNRVARCLRRLGYRRFQKRTAAGREWRYRKPLL
jgi:predicted P-loop ATPase